MSVFFERVANAFTSSALLPVVTKQLVLPATHADGVLPREQKSALPAVSLLTRGNVAMSLAYADSDSEYLAKKERVLSYDFRSFAVNELRYAGHHILSACGLLAMFF